jgi:hypothetical protein
MSGVVPDQFESVLAVADHEDGKNIADHMV